MGNKDDRPVAIEALVAAMEARDEARDAEHGSTPLARTQTRFGDRPACFQNAFQEISFVFQATVATATTSFLTGVGVIVTASIGRDLGMTQGEISWITASTS